MDEQRFWEIIETNKGNAERVEAHLAKLPLGEIAQFQRIYYDLHNRLHRWNIWGAAYVINGGCSDDGFHYFRAWLIGKGKEAYDAALKDPDSLGQFVTQNDIDETCDNESLNYAAETAYEAAGGNAEDLERNSSEFDEPSGESWDEEEVSKLFPKLAAKFG